MGPHPPRSNGPHFASLTADNQLPRMKPYSVRASTAYWLQVGTKRHVGGRRGDTMCRYSWMRKTSPRTAAFPAPPTAARTRADEFTEPFPSVRNSAAGHFAAAAPASPMTPAGYSAARGSPPDPIAGDRPTWFARHAAAAAQPGDVRPRT